MRKRLKKGFSVAECVIAMAVIVIVSAAAYPTLTKSLKKARESLEYEEMVLCTENAGECFEYYGTLDENFEKFIPKDAEVTKNEENTYYYIENQNYKVILEVNSYTLKVSVSKGVRTLINSNYKYTGGTP